MKRAISSILIATFFLQCAITTPVVYAQTTVVAGVPLPSVGVMVPPSQSFQPPLLQGLTINPENPFELDFLIDEGESSLTDEDLEEITKDIIDYFLTAMTVPEDELWVNLNPKESNRIIEDSLGATKMGRTLLAQDYILKQFTASLIFPETDLGKKFWGEVLDPEGLQNMLSKVWIIPETAKVYVHETNVFVVEQKLKVMLEDEFLGSDVLIPAIEQEINHGKNFAPLRQVFQSMILATWYKRRLKNGVLAQVYANQNKVEGVTIEEESMAEDIYAQYLKAFQQGVFSTIKEEVNTATGDMVPKKYFSGGVELDHAQIDETQPNEAWFNDMAMKSIHTAKVNLAPLSSGKVNEIKPFTVDSLFTELPLPKNFLQIVQESIGEHTLIGLEENGIAWLDVWSPVRHISKFRRFNVDLNITLQDTLRQFSNQLGDKGVHLSWSRRLTDEDPIENVFFETFHEDRFTDLKKDTKFFNRLEILAENGYSTIKLFLEAPQTEIVLLDDISAQMYKKTVELIEDNRQKFKNDTVDAAMTEETTISEIKIQQYMDVFGFEREKVLKMAKTSKTFTTKDPENVRQRWTDALEIETDRLAGWILRFPGLVTIDPARAQKQWENELEINQTGFITAIDQHPQVVGVNVADNLKPKLLLIKALGTPQLNQISLLIKIAPLNLRVLMKIVQVVENLQFESFPQESLARVYYRLDKNLKNSHKKSSAKLVKENPQNLTLIIEPEVRRIIIGMREDPRNASRDAAMVDTSEFDTLLTHIPGFNKTLANDLRNSKRKITTLEQFMELTWMDVWVIVFEQKAIFRKISRIEAFQVTKRNLEAPDYNIFIPWDREIEDGDSIHAIIFKHVSEPYFSRMNNGTAMMTAIQRLIKRKITTKREFLRRNVAKLTRGTGAPLTMKQYSDIYRYLTGVPREIDDEIKNPTPAPISHPMDHSRMPDRIFLGKLVHDNKDRLTDMVNLSMINVDRAVEMVDAMSWKTKIHLTTFEESYKEFKDYEREMFEIIFEHYQIANPPELYTRKRIMDMLWFNSNTFNDKEWIEAYYWNNVSKAKTAIFTYVFERSSGIDSFPNPKYRVNALRRMLDYVHIYNEDPSKIVLYQPKAGHSVESIGNTILGDVLSSKYNVARESNDEFFIIENPDSSNFLKVIQTWLARELRREEQRFEQFGDGKDQAMTAPGGVDLNPALWTLEEEGAPLPFTMPSYDGNISIRGIQPVILQIAPAPNILHLLGR